jgi:signal transduction histidine kinase
MKDVVEPGKLACGPLVEDQGMAPVSSSHPREFRKLLEAFHDGIVIAHDGRIVFENEAILTILGHDGVAPRPTGAPRLVRCLLSRVTRSARSQLASALIRVARGAASALECEVPLSIDQRAKFVRFFLDSISFQGRPSLMVTARDVTEYREIKELLNRSERMAAIGTLAAGVAHEINNPLSYVTTNIAYAVERVRYLDQILLGSSVQIESPSTLRLLLGPLLHALKEAHDGSHRVATIVRDLRTLSRETGGERVVVDLSRTLDVALHMAEQTYRYRAQFISDYLGVGLVWGTETRLIQVFLNLIVNAAQAFERDDPRNNLVIIRGAIEGKTTVIEVEDNGPGIAREHHEKIFSPFFTTKPVGEGTGLGLSICHGIVYSLGGTISLESEPGLGAKFRVCLETAEHESPPSKPRRTSMRPQGRARVLIIDDEILLLRSLARLLQEHHDITTARNGREGLDQIQNSGPFDLVLCDLMMPEMTGMDLYEALRRQAPEMAERFVFLTGGAFSERARTFLASIDNPKLEKPIEPHLLRNIVATFLSGID